MLKNDVIYYGVIGVSIAFIVLLLVGMILFLVFKKLQSKKVILKKTILGVLVGYVVLMIGTFCIPVQKYLIEIHSVSAYRIEYEGDDYYIWSNQDRKYILANRGKLKRFNQKYDVYIGISGYIGVRGTEWVSLDVYTNDNFDFIHFDCDFNTQDKNQEYAKIIKPFGSVVYHTYFNFSQDYFKI